MSVISTPTKPLNFAEYFGISQNELPQVGSQSSEIAEKVTLITLKILSYLTVIILLICAIGTLVQTTISSKTVIDAPINIVPTTIEKKGTKLPKTFQQLLKANIKLKDQTTSGFFKQVYRPSGSNWVIKVSNSLPIPKLLATDILFYEASKQLGLRVVPKIVYIAPDSDNFKSITQRYPSLSPVLVQSYINQSDRVTPKLNVAHAQKVVLFNWIMGRQDCKKENSAVDIHGKVWEIDNDCPLCVYSIKDMLKDHSWLEANSDIMNAHLSKETINNLLQLKEPISLSGRFIPDGDGVEMRKNKIEQTLNDNLSILKSIISSLMLTHGSSRISLNDIAKKLSETA